MEFDLNTAAKVNINEDGFFEKDTGFNINTAKPVTDNEIEMLKKEPDVWPEDLTKAAIDWNLETRPNSEEIMKKEISSRLDPPTDKASIFSLENINSYLTHIEESYKNVRSLDIVKESPELEEEYKVFKAIAYGVIPLGSKEYIDAAKKYPIARAVGEYGSLAASFALTAGAAGVVKAIPFIGRLAGMGKTGAYLARLLPKAAHLVTAGGLKETAQQAVKLATGQTTPENASKEISRTITTMALFSGPLSLSNPVVRSLGTSAYGYISAKVQGATEKQAGTQALVMLGLSLIDRSNYAEKERKQAYNYFSKMFTERAVQNKIMAYEKGMAQAQKVLNQYGKSENLVAEIMKLSKESRIVSISKVEAKSIAAQIQDIWAKNVAIAKKTGTSPALMTPGEILGANVRGTIIEGLVRFESGPKVVKSAPGVGDSIGYQSASGMKVGKITNITNEGITANIGGKEILGSLNEVFMATREQITEKELATAPMSGGRMHIPEPAPIFYSKLSGAISEKMPESADSANIMGIVKSAGIAPEEVEFSGLKDFLKDKGKVSKEEVLGYLESVKFEITETIKSGSTKYSEDQTPGGTNQREILLQVPTSERTDFKSPHYDEPNIFAHIRVNDRTTPEGKKILFIEEMQSDWAKEGRAKKEAEGVVPYHPAVKNWKKIALKRVLRIAAEEGYDGINWIPLYDVQIPSILKELTGVKLPAKEKAYIALTPEIKNKVLYEGQPILGKTPPEKGIPGKQFQIRIFRMDESMKILNTKGEIVVLPKGEEYRILPVRDSDDNIVPNKVKLMDGKQITIYTGELRKLQGQELGEGEYPMAGGQIHPKEGMDWFEEPKKEELTKETIKDYVLEELPMSERNYITKAIIEGRSVEEIAQELNETPEETQQELESAIKSYSERAETLSEEEQELVKGEETAEKKVLKDHLKGMLKPELKEVGEYANLKFLPWLFAKGKGSTPDELIGELQGMGFQVQESQDVIDLIADTFNDEIQRMASQKAATVERQAKTKVKKELQKRPKSQKKTKPSKEAEKGIGQGTVLNTSKDTDKAKQSAITREMPFTLLGNKAEVLSRLSEGIKNELTKDITQVYDLFGGSKGYRVGLFNKLPSSQYHLNEYSNERYYYDKNIQNPKAVEEMKPTVKRLRNELMTLIAQKMGIDVTKLSEDDLRRAVNKWMSRGEANIKHDFILKAIQEFGNDKLEEAVLDNFKSPNSSAIYYFLANTSVFGISNEGGTYEWSQGVLRDKIKIRDNMRRIDKSDEQLDKELKRDRDMSLSQKDGWQLMDEITQGVAKGEIEPGRTAVLVDPQYLNPTAKEGTYSVGQQDSTWKGHKENLEKHLLPLIQSGVKIIYTNNEDIRLSMWLKQHNLPYNIELSVGKVAKGAGRDETISLINYELSDIYYDQPSAGTQQYQPGEITGTSQAYEEYKTQRIDQKVADYISKQAKEFKTEKEFIDALNSGAIVLPEELMEEGVTELAIDEGLGKELYAEVKKDLRSVENELKRQIYANAAVRGISKAELDRTVKKLTGRGSISNKTITKEELLTVLNSLKKVRPKRIGGRMVITKATEDAIQIAKRNMIESQELTEDIYQQVLEDFRVSQPKYVGSFQFVTEKKGKEILLTMRNLANIYKYILPIQNSYEYFTPVKDYVTAVMESVPEKELLNLQPLLDTHHAYDNLELQSKLPFGKAFELLREHWHLAHEDIGDTMKRTFDVAGKNWAKIVNNEESLARMQQYIGFKLPKYVRGKPSYPKGITTEEQAIVDKMIDYALIVTTNIQYERVVAYVNNNEPIPNAPTVELKKAELIYLTKGEDALKNWLTGRTWGLITGGAYDFGSVVKRRVKLHKTKPGFSKRGLISKESIQYSTYDDDLVTRFKSYVRGVTLRKHLRNDVNSIKTMIELVQHRFANPGKALDLVNRNLLEVLGEKTSTPQILENFIRNTYSQAARTLFLDARKGVRNLFQNLALYIDIQDLFIGTTLGAEDHEYFDMFVKMEKSIKFDYLYSGFKGLDIPGIKNLNELADTINVMGKTDTINRALAFRAKLGAVRRALANNRGYMNSTEDLMLMMKEAGMADLTAMERVHALDRLITEGEDAFARYVAKEVTEKIHFLYTRFERGMAEQGTEAARVFSNLLVFKKGLIQRLALDIGRLRPSQKKVEGPIGGKKRATKSLFVATVWASIVGMLYMLVTGDKNNPYRPDHIMGGLSIGGLATGTQEKLHETSYILSNAILGDKEAQKKAFYTISSANKYFIPFYDEITDVLEASFDKKKIDQQFMKEIQGLITNRYVELGTTYEKERSTIEKLKHGIFGTEAKEREKLKFD